MNRRIVLSVLVIVLLTLGGGNVILASDISLEEELFSEEDLFSEDIFVEEEQVLKNDVAEELNERRIGVSGEVNTATTFVSYDSAYDWLQTGKGKKGQLSNSISANVFFDVRLPNGIKSFLNLEASYFPEGVEEVIFLDEELANRTGISYITTEKYTDLGLKEFFIDTHWNNRVYFRTGKQVLKWGRSYFWNPTDLINVERRDFFDLNKNREGTYGTRVHIPYGAEKNLYFFIGMEGVEEIDDLALSGKYEFLVGNTEMAFSAWIRKDSLPVYGFDFSGRIEDIDIRGEISLSQDYGNGKTDNENLQGIINENQDRSPRVSAGFTKYFDHGDINDRVSLTGEFYYNPDGFDKNIFKQLKEKADTLGLEAGFNLKKDFLMDIYEPYMNSRYYLALFTSVQKFLIAEASLNINSLINLVDSSSVLTTGISYSPSLADWSLDLSISGYLGDKDTEATFSGNRYSIGLGSSLLF